MDAFLSTLGQWATFQFSRDEVDPDELDGQIRLACGGKQNCDVGESNGLDSFGSLRRWERQFTKRAVRGVEYPVGLARIAE